MIKLRATSSWRSVIQFLIDCWLPEDYYQLNSLYNHRDFPITASAL